MAFYLRDMKELDERQLQAGDFNDDSKVDIRDLVMIAEILRNIWGAEEM